MIDNKRLTEAQIESLATIPYQTQVEIFERHCATCPFRLVQIGTESGDHFHKKMTYVDYSDVPYSEAILILQELFTNTDKNVKFKRGCQYSEELSLLEIVMNTCRFWNTATIEGGLDLDSFPDSFTEGEDIEQFRKAYRG